MYSRLFTVLLRLLPGNVYQSPDNPLQVDRLPDHSGVELDYPVFQDTPAAARKHTLVLLFFAVLIAPILAWTAHLVPVPLIHGGLNTIALMAASALVVIGFFGRWWPLGSYAIAITVLPIVALLVRDIPYSLVALLLAIGATVIFSDALVRSFLFLKTAAPLPRQRALEIRARGKWRWISLLHPLPGFEFYALNFVLLGIAGWIVLQYIAEPNNEGDFWQAARLFFRLAALGLAWFLVHEMLLSLIYARWFLSPWRGIGALYQAVVEWATYNRLNTHGVGVHRSPAGACATRRFLLIGVTIAWACLWAGLQEQASGASNWLREAIETQVLISGIKSMLEMHQEQEQQRRPTLLRPDEAPNPSQPPPLTDKEKDFLRRLSPKDADEYVQKRVRVHRQQQAKAEAAKQESEATRRPGDLLLKFIVRLAGVALDVLIPSVITLACFGGLVFGVTASSLAGLEAQLGRGPRQRVLSTANWRHLIARVRHSTDKIEKRSVFLGTNSRDDTPVLVPREVFHEHAHVLGDSGSGKTSLGLVPLITQLMKGGGCSIVVIDLKADDQFLLDSLRRESAHVERGLQRKNPEGRFPFRWFTTVIGRSSFAFNPMAQRVMSTLPPDQQADILTAALGLQYGSEYGRKYFGDANFEILHHALRENRNIETFAELAEVLAGIGRFPFPEETKKAGSHVLTAIRRLARCSPLNVGRSSRTPQSILDHSIDLTQLFSQPQALYVALPPVAGISTTAEIARLFLYSLLASAQAHPRPRKPVFLVVDEFQRIVSKNVELFLQQARSMNIGCIFSNQSLADLDSVDADLIAAVRGNTRFRQIFGAGNQADLEDILSTAGETVFGMRNWSFTPHLLDWALQGVSVSEQRGSRLTLNDIFLATDAPGRSITYVRRGAGYAQYGGLPFVMDSVHHISEPAFKRRVKAKWPAQDERTLVATIDNPPEGSTLAGQILGQPLPPRPHGDSTSSGVKADAGAVAEVPGDGLPVTPDPSAPVVAELVEDTAQGLDDDLVTRMYLEQQAQEAARRKKNERKSKMLGIRPPH